MEIQAKSLNDCNLASREKFWPPTDVIFKILKALKGMISELVGAGVL